MGDVDRQANCTPIMSFRVDVNPLENPFLATEAAVREAIEGAVGHLVSARHVSVRPLEAAASAPTPIFPETIDIVTAPSLPWAFSKLTSREQEVLEGLAAGKNNREIGEGLHIAMNTVRQHVGHILTKLQARNRTEAAMLYQRSLLNGHVNAT